MAAKAHPDVKHPQYNPTLDNPPLNDDELNQLESLLAHVPGDEAMDIEGLDGYLTALLLSPQLPSADDWVPRLWGGNPGAEAPFASGKQTKRVVQLALRHMASIDRQLHADADMLEPFFAIAERDDAVAGDDEGDEIDGLWVDAGNWCTGFLLATELQPELWSPLFDDPELAEMLEPIVLLGSDPGALDDAQRTRVADVPGRDHLSRQVPDIIAALWQQKQDEEKQDEGGQTEKV